MTTLSIVLGPDLLNRAN